MAGVSHSTSSACILSKSVSQPTMLGWVYTARRLAMTLHLEKVAFLIQASSPRSWN